MEGKEKKRSRVWGDRAEEYLDALCGQIHWKSYRKAIRDELKDHIEDASSEMRKKGLSADQALEKALCDLGDPEKTGKKLNRIYRPSWNKRLAAFAMGMEGFFIRDYVRQFRVFGPSGAAGLAEQTADFPLMLCVSRYSSVLSPDGHTGDRILFRKLCEGRAEQRR